MYPGCCFLLRQFTKPKCDIGLHFASESCGLYSDVFLDLSAICFIAFDIAKGFTELVLLHWCGWQPSENLFALLLLLYWAWFISSSIHLFPRKTYFRMGKCYRLHLLSGASALFTAQAAFSGLYFSAFSPETLWLEKKFSNTFKWSSTLNRSILSRSSDLAPAPLTLPLCSIVKWIHCTDYKQPNRVQDRFCCIAKSRNCAEFGDLSSLRWK